MGPCFGTMRRLVRPSPLCPVVLKQPPSLMGPRLEDKISPPELRKNRRGFRGPIDIHGVRVSFIRGAGRINRVKVTDLSTAFYVRFRRLWQKLIQIIERFCLKGGIGIII